MKNQLNENFKILFFILTFIGMTSYSPRAEALDSKVKAVLTMAAYGTVGGGLLGAASLAFDTGGRAPFIGLSVGLYVGLLFGTFIVVSHKMKKYKDENPVPKENYYPDSDGQSPYEGGSGSSWFGGDDEEVERWNQALTLDDLSVATGHQKIMRWNSKVKRSNPVFYMNLWNYQF
jgi:hypothetical protein